MVGDKSSTASSVSATSTRIHNNETSTRAAGIDDITVSRDLDNCSDEDITPPPEKRLKYDELLSHSFWDQGEAWKLFDPKRQHKSVLKAIDARVDALKKANDNVDGWQYIMDVNGYIEMITPYHIFNVRQKFIFLIQALDIAKKDMNGLTFYQCCRKATESLNCLGLKITQDVEVVRRWYREFCDRGNCFGNTNPLGRKTQATLMFEHLPAGKESFITYANENLVSLSGELMLEYVVYELAPEFYNDYNDTAAPGDVIPIDEKGKEILIKKMGYKNMGVGTMNIWLNTFGYKYCRLAKGYYNDKHEEPPNILYQNDYIHRYFGYKLRSHRWIHINMQEHKHLVEIGKLQKGEGYGYIEEDTGLKMFEYHVDQLGIEFHKHMNQETYFGGNLSVRRKNSKKPLIILGQYEAIVKQFIMPPMYCIGTGGMRSPAPKYEGQGVMVSNIEERHRRFGLGG